MICWEGVCHRYTKILRSTAVHTLTPYSMGVRPPVFEVVCIRESGYASNALFCILDVWQDFIRVVVLRYLNRSKNFHGRKNTRRRQFEI